MDVVDIHRSYQSQARERIAYYKKCGYKILDSDASEEVMKKKDGPVTYGFVDDD